MNITTTPKPSPLGLSRRKRILVLEDESILAYVASRVLEREVVRHEDGTTEQRFDVMTFGSPGEAIAQPDFHDFDVYLLDVNLKADLTGRDVASMLMAKNPAARIILTSGDADAMAATSGRFLAKPWSGPALVGMVDTVLGNGHD